MPIFDKYQFKGPNDNYLDIQSRQGAGHVMTTKNKILNT